MEIVLQTNDNGQRLELRDIWRDDTIYECRIFISLDGFTVDRKFFFEWIFLLDFLKNLEHMNKELSGEAILKCEYEEEFIKVSCISQGHIRVAGLIVDQSWLRQEFRFEFETDQTMLGPLIRDIELVKDMVSI